MLANKSVSLQTLNLSHVPMWYVMLKTKNKCHCFGLIFRNRDRRSHDLMLHQNPSQKHPFPNHSPCISPPYLPYWSWHHTQHLKTWVEARWGKHRHMLSFSFSLKHQVNCPQQERRWGVATDSVLKLSWFRSCHVSSWPHWPATYRWS